MAEEKNIELKNMIVHILDSSVQVPVLSECEQPDDGDAYEFIEKHIQKIMADDSLKDGYFTNVEGKIKAISERLFYEPGNFIEASRDIAGMLYDLMLKYPDIPSADLICSLFEIEGEMYFSILKFNYRPSYIHYVRNSSSGSTNSIIKQKTGLPGEGQKIDECAIIKLKDLSLKVIEKKFDIDGEKRFYFSDMFLECSCDMSPKEKIKKFKKATDSFNKKFLQEDLEQSADMRTAITRCLDEKDEIDVNSIAEDVFKKKPDLKKFYVEHMESAGVLDKAIKVDEKVSEKVFRRHSIKTDTGIEINLPVEYYNDKGKVEFISNPDGTISIVIKNVTSITDC